ncbi:MAG: NAD(P)/FAD-dependent oxidoreductase [Chitinophagaceae bacterium]|nr:NAD(P)/FAD-dependent oxidoreductase [Chitinophagaceae bacterium]
MALLLERIYLMIYDAIIVGGGPAGLNAAVVLGRCKRKILVFDSGKYRNSYSSGLHNYLSRDGILPKDFLELAREEVTALGISILPQLVTTATKTADDHFTVHVDHAISYTAKILLLATGVKDRLPEVPGIEEYYGISVHHCPYCDGWEERDKKMVLYSKHINGFGMAVSLKTWSADVTLLTDGKMYLSGKQRSTLAHYNINVIQKPVASVQGTSGRLQSVSFSDGQILECDTLFFTDNYEQHCGLVTDLQCSLNSKGVVRTNNVQQTNIEGLYVAGDASKDMHLVVVAAAQGAKAGIAINKSLQLRERPLFPV